MNDFRREFFRILYDQWNGIPENWEVKKSTVKNDFVEFKPVPINSGEDSIMYKFLIEFDMGEINVIQAVAKVEIENNETTFEDPEKAALFLQGALSSSSFIKQNTVNSSSDSESDDDPLSELFE